MATTNFTSIDEYIASRPDEVQPVLQRVRGILRKAIPDAIEVISYQIPALRSDGGIIVYFAGWKEHFSIYPVTDPLVEAFGEELLPYRAGKGTLRFSLDQPVPAKLIARVARFRAEETAERAKAKKAVKKAAKKAR